MAKQNSAARFCGSKALLGGQNTNDTDTQDPYPSIPCIVPTHKPHKHKKKIRYIEYFDTYMEY